MGMLVGCGKSDNAATQSQKLLQFHVMMPVGLTRAEQRYKAFQSRVMYVAISAHSKEGEKLEKKVPFSEKLFVNLEDFNFPKNNEDQIILKIAVWDRIRSGQIRDFPALNGTSRVKVQELDLNAENAIPIRLNLNVSVKEYDP